MCVSIHLLGSVRGYPRSASTQLRGRSSTLLGGQRRQSLGRRPRLLQPQGGMGAETRLSQALGSFGLEGSWRRDPSAQRLPLGQDTAGYRDRHGPRWESRVWIPIVSVMKRPCFLFSKDTLAFNTVPPAADTRPEFVVLADNTG